MKTLKDKILQIIAAFYCVLYFAGFVMPFFSGEMSLSNPEDLSVLAAFLVFLCGFAVSWFSERIGGYLLQFWVVFIWALGLFYWPDAGMVMVLSVPVLVIGVFMNRKAYLKSIETRSKQLDWKYTLQLFLFNYVLLYILVVASDITGNKHIDYMSLPYILFPILLVLFMAGFAFSFRNKKIAGFIMMLWYAIVVLGTSVYSDFSNTGPWFVFGIPVLLHGILYLVYHSEFRTE